MAEVKLQKQILGLIPFPFKLNPFNFYQWVAPGDDFVFDCLGIDKERRVIADRRVTVRGGDRGKAYLHVEPMIRIDGRLSLDIFSSPIDDSVRFGEHRDYWYLSLFRTLPIRIRVLSQ